jgi:hypothetical protein
MQSVIYCSRSSLGIRPTNGLIALMESNNNNKKKHTSILVHRSATTWQRLAIRTKQGCNSLIKFLLRLQKIVWSSLISSVFWNLFCKCVFIRVIIYPNVVPKLFIPRRFCVVRSFKSVWPPSPSSGRISLKYIGDFYGNVAIKQTWL